MSVDVTLPPAMPEDAVGDESTNQQLITFDDVTWGMENEARVFLCRGCDKPHPGPEG